MMRDDLLPGRTGRSQRYIQPQVPPLELGRRTCGNEDRTNIGKRNRLMRSGHAWRIESWLARSMGLFGILALGTAVAAPPSEYSTIYGTKSCATAGCHGGPPPSLSSAIVPSGAAATSGANLRAIMTANGTMGTILTPGNGLTDTVLNTIRLYLVDVRDGGLVPSAGSSTDFGSSAVTAASAVQEFTITNERGVSASFAAAPSGSNSEFVPVAGGTCLPATTLASGASCTVRMQFTPAGTGARSGALRFTLNSPIGVTAQSRSLTLTGTGTSQFSIIPGTLDFGSITATTAAVQSAFIRNLGGASFSLNSFTFGGGASAGLYTLAPGNACTPGLSLAAGALCRLDVRFSPVVAGSPLNASLTIAHSADGTPQLVTLLGSATAAPQGQIQLTSLSLTFPDTQLGSTTALSITLSNNGSAALNLTGFTMGGANPGDFLRSGNCSIGTPLAVSAQCTLTMTFQPSALLARSASLTIQSDASNGAAVIALGGTGVPVPAPRVSLLPATLDFGPQTLAGLYPKRVITLKNTGTATLSVSSITVLGTGFTNASTAACPATLAPGASCAVEISFNPVAANTDYSGTLRVISNAAGSPHTATLLGRGTATTIPVLLWSPAITLLEFGSVSAGTVSAPQSVTLLNNGPGGVTLGVVNAVGADAPAFPAGGGTCVPGLTLFQGGTCTIEVRFAPASAGSRSASLQVASSGSFPPALTVSGTGLAGPTPGLALSTGALSLGETRVGAQSLPADVVLSGTGSGVVTVVGMQVYGPYSMQSKTCPAVPFTLSAGSTCTVTVAFEPQSEGDAAGVLRVTSDASPAVREVALSGKGVPAAKVSGGGCTISADNLRADPMLWILVLLAVAALFYRYRAREARARGLP